MNNNNFNLWRNNYTDHPSWNNRDQRGRNQLNSSNSNFNPNADVFVPRAVNMPQQSHMSQHHIQPQPVQYVQQHHIQHMQQQPVQHLQQQPVQHLQQQPIQHMQHVQQQLLPPMPVPDLQNQLRLLTMHSYQPDSENQVHSEIGYIDANDKNDLELQQGLAASSQIRHFETSSELSHRTASSAFSIEVVSIKIALEHLIINDSPKDFEMYVGAIILTARALDVEAKKIVIETICEMVTMTQPTVDDDKTEYKAHNILVRAALELYRAGGLFSGAIFPAFEKIHLKSISSKLPPLDLEQKGCLIKFFGEVYRDIVQDTSLDLDVQGLIRLGRSITTQLKILLEPQNLSDEGMNLLIDIFKLTGRELDFFQDLRVEVDKVLTIVGGYANGSRKLSKPTVDAIHSLLYSRKKSWTTKECSAYLPNGNKLELTEEESDFLEENLKPDSEEEEEEEYRKFEAETEMREEFAKKIRKGSFH